MNSIDLEPFVQWLRQRSLADEKHAPYYAHWARRFLQSDGERTGLCDDDRLLAFSDLLERDGTLQDWQRQQAVRAAELYLKGFLKEKREGTTDPKLPASTDAEAEAAVAKTRQLLRLRHYSYRTETTYLDWIGRFLRYCGAHKLPWSEPSSMRSFLSYLAEARNVAASTQNQAFNSLLFLMREVLKQDLGEINAVRARRGPKLPVVLSVDEVRRILDAVPPGTKRLLLEVTYGAGLRVSETVRLRVKDLDFDQCLVFVRAAKGDKDRSTLLPRRLVEPLRAHLLNVKALHEEDLVTGKGDVWLPGALAVKYPHAPREWAWQYCFPAAGFSTDPRSGKTHRHHIDEQVLQRIMREAVRRADIAKPASVHTLRHSFATHLLMQGVNIREVQEYLGHASVETTMIYTHVIRTLTHKAESPLDAIRSAE